MAARSTSPPHPIQIGLIANNDRTVSDLLRYLTDVGTQARHFALLRERIDWPKEGGGLHAVVIFPDDFDGAVMAQLLEQLGRCAPSLLQLIVTRQPQRFGSSPVPPTSPPPRLIIPRPTFGWRILDAIRAHLENESGLDG